MPDADGFPLPDEIIQGAPPRRAPSELFKELCASIDAAGRDPGFKTAVEQQTAIAMITSGHPFVLVSLCPEKDGVAVKPGEDFDGCSARCILGGATEPLVAHHEDLAEVIDKAYHQRGLF